MMKLDHKDCCAGDDANADDYGMVLMMLMMMTVVMTVVVLMMSVMLMTRRVMLARRRWTARDKPLFTFQVQSRLSICTMCSVFKHFFY